MALTKVGAGVLNIDDLYGFRNRIINGDMRIDQRNAGVLVNPAVSGYTVDRWTYFQPGHAIQTPKGTIGQNAGSVTPPTGFTNYLGFTSTSAYSILVEDQFIIRQNIEGLNVSDLGWGTANAQAVTLSFWVRSSLTGSFGGAFQNHNRTRNYPFVFTINSANTWEQKTVTVSGDTTGTWLTTNGTGITVTFNLGTGSTYSATANVWNATQFVTAPTGATSVVGTNGATFYITGVQLEKGTVATPFERRPFGTELALCQRYYEQYGPGYRVNIGVVAATGTNAAGAIKWLVVKRASPAVTVSGAWRTLGVNQGNGTTLAFNEIRAEGAGVLATADFNYTAGVANTVQSDDPLTGRVNISAEL